MQPDPMQQIFDGAEAVSDAIHLASGCNRALMVLLDRIDDVDLGHQTAALIAATERFLTDARAGADRVTRMAMER